MIYTYSSIHSLSTSDILEISKTLQPFEYIKVSYLSGDTTYLVWSNLVGIKRIRQHILSEHTIEVMEDCRDRRDSLSTALYGGTFNFSNTMLDGKYKIIDSNNKAILEIATKMLKGGLNDLQL